MYPIQSQDPIVSSVLAYQKELQGQSKQNDLQKLCSVKDQNRKQVFSRQGFFRQVSFRQVFSKLALPIANIMIQSGQQLKEHCQAT